MISSRRLAREWALKILYQSDVGKSRLSEAMESTMEHLRREFVLRGSRTAIGSAAEQICMECVTRSLQDSLSDLTRSMERMLVFVTGRLLEEGPYWVELRLEKSFRNQARGTPLIPPRLLIPMSEPMYLPGATDPLASAYSLLKPKELVCLTEFIRLQRLELPALLDKELKQEALQFAKELVRERPVGVGAETTQSYLRERRVVYNEAQAERWSKIGAIVQKQTGDWLRTAAFTVCLVQGVKERQEEIDQAIEELSSGWRLARQAAVDRNILRLAGYEMLYLSTVPIGATINEAVELAKKYSTAESGRFVNGVLGALTAKSVDKTPSYEVDEGDDAIDLPDISDIEEKE